MFEITTRKFRLDEDEDLDEMITAIKDMQGFFGNMKIDGYTITADFYKTVR